MGMFLLTTGFSIALQRKEQSDPDPCAVNTKPLLSSHPSEAR